MATQTAPKNDILTSDGLDDRLTDIVRHYKQHVIGDTVNTAFVADTPDDRAVRDLAVWFEQADRRPSKKAPVLFKYKAFTDQLAKQAKLLFSFGYTIEVVDHDPFGSAAHLVSYVRNSQHLPVMSTDTGDFPADHPLTNQTPFQDINGRQLCWNDLFRWVHDILGHVHLGADNAPFTLHGEWRSWKMHRQMFEGDALEILGTEAIAQIAWMARAPRFDDDPRPVDEREFPAQKIVATPPVLLDAVA